MKKKGKWDKFLFYHINFQLVCLFFPFDASIKFDCIKYYYIKRLRWCKKKQKKVVHKKLCSLQISFDSHSILWLFTHSAVYFFSPSSWLLSWVLVFAFFLLFPFALVALYIFFPAIEKKISLSFFYSMSKIS